MKGVLPLDAFGQHQIRTLGSVGHIGALLVLQENELAHVVEGKSQQRVHAPVMLQAPLDELCVHQLPDQWRRQQADPRCDDLLFHVPADRLRRIGIHAGFPDQRLDNAPAVPSDDVFAGSPDEEGDIRRVRGGDHRLVLMVPSGLSSARSAAREIASSW